VIITVAPALGTGLWMTLPVALVVAVALHRLRPNLFKWLADTAVSATLLQIATVVGAVNGFRGRWNVWHSGSSSGRPALSALAPRDAHVGDAG
jgi:hypothetical protein